MLDMTDCPTLPPAVPNLLVTKRIEKSNPKMDRVDFRLLALGLQATFSGDISRMRVAP